MLKISETYYTKASVLERFATCSEFLSKRKWFESKKSKGTL